MNLPQFLKEVDRLTDVLSHDELSEFIHEIARILPESQRDSFVDMLRSAGSHSDSDMDIAGLQRADKRNESEDIAKLVEEIREKLIEINEGERCLDSEYNEEWDDWYNSDVPEVLFHDPDGVLTDVNQAMELIHRCVDTEAYREGCELAEVLSVLEITAEGDYDGSVLTMFELYLNNLLHHDFKHFLGECLYLTYMGTSLEDRPDELFCMMGNFGYYDIRLEDILQTGNEELSEFDKFLPLWISFLGQRKGKPAGRFLEEAQSMLQDEDALLDNARKFADVHPSLYEQFLRMKMDSGEDEKMLAIGMEAIDKIPESFKVRSDVALLAGTYASRLKDDHMAEKCWLEAFRSDSSVTGYLRLRFLVKDWSCCADEVRTIYEQVYNDTKRKNRDTYYDRDSQSENLLGKNDYCIMMFFDGRFDLVLKVGMNEKNALGWSSTFMKQGLALSLLLLYQDELDGNLPKGLRDMLARAISACKFDAGEYYKGTEHQLSGNTQEVFCDLFNRWKHSVQIPAEVRDAWLDRIDRWIALRVTGIMENNHRKYYGECASFIAALGEVQESAGDVHAKSRIMEHYRSEYSRRRAFHQELRNYGMR